MIPAERRKRDCAPADRPNSMSLPHRASVLASEGARPGIFAGITEETVFPDGLAVLARYDKQAWLFVFWRQAATREGEQWGVLQGSRREMPGDGRATACAARSE